MTPLPKKAGNASYQPFFMGNRIINAARLLVANAGKNAPSSPLLGSQSCSQDLLRGSSVAVGMSGMPPMIVVMFMATLVPGHVLNLYLHVLAAGVTEVQRHGEVLTGLQRARDP